jgi:hypothetical protein
MARENPPAVTATRLDQAPYAGLPEKEQRRLLEKKLATLRARGIRPVLRVPPEADAGPLSATLAYLDALLTRPERAEEASRLQAERN